MMKYLIPALISTQFCLGAHAQAVNKLTENEKKLSFAYRCMADKDYMSKRGGAISQEESNLMEYKLRRLANQAGPPAIGMEYMNLLQTEALALTPPAPHITKESKDALAMANRAINASWVERKNNCLRFIRINNL
jgi:hypothetical protein